MSNVIELRELRIGNVLLYKGIPHYVSLLSMDIDDEYQDIIGVVEIGKTTGEKADWNRAMVKDLNRVSISDYALTKCGYQYANENGQKFYWHTDLPYFQLRIDDDEWLMYYSIHDIPEDILITYSGLTAIHHLQNLHFTLTGNELTIK